MAKDEHARVPSEIILYQTEDGLTRVQIAADIVTHFERATRSSPRSRAS